MTTPKPPPVDLLEFLDELEDEANEEVRERVAKLSDEEVLAELKAKGLDPEDAWAAGQRALEKAGQGGAPPAAPTARPAGVVDLAQARARRKTPVLGLALAIAAGVTATVGFVKRDALEAWIHGPVEETPQPPGVPPTHEETPQEKAAKLREQAFVKVAEGYYGEAEDLLDQAKATDPEGDEAGRVKAARGQIKASKPEYPGYAKPPVGPVEHPLPRTPPRAP